MVIKVNAKRESTLRCVLDTIINVYKVHNNFKIQETNYANLKILNELKR